jgi:predicted nucleotidyltransferase
MKAKLLLMYGFQALGSSAVMETILEERLADMPQNRGPFASEDEALIEVVKRLVHDLDPEQVWLFGSRAEGRSAPDSDFDLLVVTKVEDGDAGFDYDAVYAPIKGIGVGCDVVPCRIDEFEEERKDPTSLCWQIVHSAKLLYERCSTNTGILHAG